MTFFGWACLYIYICAGMTYYIVCVCILSVLFDKFTTVYTACTYVPVCVCVCIIRVSLPVDNCRTRGHR